MRDAAAHCQSILYYSLPASGSAQTAQNATRNQLPLITCSLDRGELAVQQDNPAWQPHRERSGYYS
jgi:hypothetical protein